MSKSLKVLMVGDSPLGTTGFGRVQKTALKAFLRQGWEVTAVTALQFEERETDLPLTQIPTSRDDPQGFKRLVRLFETEEVKPDVVYVTGDPGSIVGFASFIPASIPFFAYTPVEGEPIILPSWINVLKSIEWMTCSEYGQRVAKSNLDRDIDFAYHGVDTDVFYPDENRRNEVRKQLGWDDKFVIISVAANVRRKQHPRLFEAMAILRQKYNQKDIVLYDHTVPFQNFLLEGWNLPFVALAFGHRGEVVFNPALSKMGEGIPEDGKGLTLPDFYRAADLFVLPSQVEGFGLPTVEAMASGVPVVVTKYAAGWEVAQKGQGVGIPVHDWEIHKSGTRLANVSPDALAKIIVGLKRNPKQRAKMAAAGIEAAKTIFKWDDFEEKVVNGVQTAVEVGGIAPQEESLPPQNRGVQAAESIAETIYGLHQNKDSDGDSEAEVAADFASPYSGEHPAASAAN